MSEFELSLYCNDEIIAIHQDAAFDTAMRDKALEPACGSVHVYKKRLEDGNTAIAVFNMGETQERFDVKIEKAAAWRDVWAKKNLGESDAIALDMPPHTVRVFKLC